MYSPDATYYRFAFQTPAPGERGLYCLGHNPLLTGGRHVKPLDAEGLARLWVEFERLYDTNYQAYNWLWYTGYGAKVYDTLRDVLERDHGPDHLDELIIRFIMEVRRTM